MRGRVSKARKISKNVKVSAKKKKIDKTLEPTPIFETKPLEKRKNKEIEIPIPVDIKERTDLFQTPYKGFRPFDLSTPIPAILPLKDKKNDFIQNISLNNESIQKTDENISTINLSKNLQISEPPGIWCVGIENIEYQSNEFDFECFPIQY